MGSAPMRIPTVCSPVYHGLLFGVAAKASMSESPPSSSVPKRATGPVHTGLNWGRQQVLPWHAACMSREERATREPAGVGYCTTRSSLWAS